MGRLGKAKPSLQARVLSLAIAIIITVMVASDQLAALATRNALKAELLAQVLRAAEGLARMLDSHRPGMVQKRLAAGWEKIGGLLPDRVRVDVRIRKGDDIRLLASIPTHEEYGLAPCEQEAWVTGAAKADFVVDEAERHYAVAAVPLHLYRAEGLLTIVSHPLALESPAFMNARPQFTLLLATILLLILGVHLLFRLAVYPGVKALTQAMENFRTGRTEVADLPRPATAAFPVLAAQLSQLFQEVARRRQHMRRRILDATRAVGHRQRRLERLHKVLSTTQKRLLRAEHLALVGQLTAAFAREIGLPLDHLSEHLEQLRRLEHPDRIQRRLAIAGQETARIRQIVRNLEPEARGQEAPATLDLVEIMRRVHFLLEPVLESRQVRFSYAGPHHLRLRGFPDQWRQVFLNLFNNATDAITEPSGWLRVEADRRNNGGQGWIRLRIADSGCGFSPEQLQKIFTTFYTTKILSKGTGLGLSVCRDILHRHGGTIRAEQQPGGGAVFILEVPESGEGAETPSDHPRA